MKARLFDDNALQKRHAELTAIYTLLETHNIIASHDETLPHQAFLVQFKTNIELLRQAQMSMADFKAFIHAHQDTLAHAIYGSNEPYQRIMAALEPVRSRSPSPTSVLIPVKDNIEKLKGALNVIDEFRVTTAYLSYEQPLSPKQEKFYILLKATFKKLQENQITTAEFRTFIRNHEMYLQEPMYTSLDIYNEIMRTFELYSPRITPLKDSVVHRPIKTTGVQINYGTTFNVIAPFIAMALGVAIGLGTIKVVLLGLLVAALVTTLVMAAKLISKCCANKNDYEALDTSSSHHSSSDYNFTPIH